VGNDDNLMFLANGDNETLWIVVIGQVPSGDNTKFQVMLIMRCGQW
jgi:hypothetical protein